MEHLAKVKASPAVQEALGTPIEEGTFVSGNINVSGPSGQANISIPVSGPKGKGTVIVVAAKSGGQWSFSKLAVDIKHMGKQIDLLGPQG